MSAPSIKPTHKAIQAYYEALQQYGAHSIIHETALRSAFQNLLAETARTQKWTLVPELTMKVKGKNIRPDGTLRDDEWQLPRGFWEAKDTTDVLDVEIRKKIALGYPLVNTIFEDTRQGVLFQNGQRVMQARLDDRGELAALLNHFYAHTERDIEGFEQAVSEFQERIPALAKALLGKIQAAHKKNRAFQTAFDGMLELCRSALNPNISIAAVDEMLVQHLLTERLFDRIFRDLDFVRRNVIAREIETVIDALVSQSFNRDEFLKSLDPFYKAIESAARTLDDFTEKQHFLNTVYERFFQGYSVKLADTHGIIYTPQEVAGFMCASVEEVLQSEFGKRLGDPGVHMLDPCTGTGNFVVHLLQLISKNNPRELRAAYAERLFANEVMLLPYYIAAQNIEHEYFELTGEYQPFEGLCFVDTLELAEAKHPEFSFMTEANTVRVKREREAPITVVIGNPPYNMGQQNENDNNKNRSYEVIDKRIRDTYVKDSKAVLRNKLYDAYVKFFRWAIDRLQGRDGIVCFVSNNSFLNQIAFDGMRRHLVEDFTRIYHIDLHGNVRQNPKLSGTTHNVFGIQVGVGITVAVKSSALKKKSIYYCRLPEDWRKETKLRWLSERQTLAAVDWQSLSPDNEHNWFHLATGEEFKGHIPLASKSASLGVGAHAGALFQEHSPGVNTARDGVLFAHVSEELQERLPSFCDFYNSEVDRYHRRSQSQGQNIDAFVDYSKIKWSSTLKRHCVTGTYVEFKPNRIRSALYRPYSRRALYYDEILIDRPGRFRRMLPPLTEGAERNQVICVTGVGSSKPFHCIATAHIPGFDLLEKTSCFSFYTYDEDGTNRRENITDWALTQFRTDYKDKKITKWDIFHYVYGVLHQPGYREKFAENLKRELPRIPLLDDFRNYADAGRRLAELHVGYEEVEGWPLRWVNTCDGPIEFRVEKMKLSKDKSALVVNDTLTLADIPPEVFAYRLGNRSALDWVIDQYQVSTDKRSGITSDPNRDDDPEYIVRLVEKVVRVSVETVAIVAGL